MTGEEKSVLREGVEVLEGKIVYILEGLTTAGFECVTIKIENKNGISKGIKRFDESEFKIFKLGVLVKAYFEKGKCMRVEEVKQ